RRLSDVARRQGRDRHGFGPRHRPRGGAAPRETRREGRGERSRRALRRHRGADCHARPGGGGRDQEDGRPGGRQRRQRGRLQGRQAHRQCALDTFGKLNIVVNNAGILRDRMIFNMAEEDWDAVVAVHLKGTFNMCRHACEYWREEHKKGNELNGRIINTSSDAGLLGNVGQSNYGACKAAVAAMAIIIGQEMKKYGVTANAIAPVARTRLTVDATPSTAALMGAEPKPGEFDMFSPANVAPLVAWLVHEPGDQR